MLSKVFLLKLGQCCGLGCSLCPYISKHSGLTDNDLAVELGQLLNTQYIIIPTMTKIGKSYSFTAKLINVESGQIIRVASFINRLLEIDEYVEKCTRHIANEICG